MVHRLHWGADLQERPEGGADRRCHSPGPHRPGDRLPLHVPGALPGQTKRPEQALPDGGKAGRDPGHLRGGGPDCNLGERETALPDLALSLGEMDFTPAALLPGSLLLVCVLSP